MSWKRRPQRAAWRARPSAANYVLVSMLGLLVVIIMAWGSLALLERILGK